MKRKILLLGSGIFLYLSVNSQNFNLLTDCLKNDCLRIDTCISNGDTLKVIHYEEYLIHARFQNLSNDEVDVKIVAVFKRTNYPILGYAQIMDKEGISDIIQGIKMENGHRDNQMAGPVKSRKSKNASINLARK